MQTQCTGEAVYLGRVESRKVVADFEGGRISSDAGALLRGIRWCSARCLGTWNFPVRAGSSVIASRTRPVRLVLLPICSPSTARPSDCIWRRKGALKPASRQDFKHNPIVHR